ncbi:type VI secretion system TssO [Sungkyunkwania multivorans]|uniref:Type VI secretion system TssO n=1 Tax=Sungkyunkwania multivorans TaxID=1173618 RepID=A0ABW3D0M2_9FLAO
MKPKNSKERRNSFLRFMLLFLITTALIVVTFFFDFNRVPLKENKVLRTESEMIEKELAFQKKFSDGMVDIKELIDSLDVPGQNIAYLNTVINSKIVDLQKSIPQKDSTYRYKMYNNIIDSYIDIQGYKEELRNYEDTDKIISQYKEELDRTRQELNEAMRALNAYRN